jgi:hypothetical protein
MSLQECYSCRGNGHFYRDCPNRGVNIGNRNEVANENECHEEEENNGNYEIADIPRKENELATRMDEITKPKEMQVVASTEKGENEVEQNGQLDLHIDTERFAESMGFNLKEVQYMMKLANGEGEVNEIARKFAAECCERLQAAELLVKNPSMTSEDAEVWVRRLKEEKKRVESPRIKSIQMDAYRGRGEDGLMNKESNQDFRHPVVRRC